MTAHEIIALAKDLPVVSETVRKLTVQLKQPDLHRDELVHTIRCDHILTAKLLRVCNSADGGLREAVVSVDQALLILGDNAVFRMVCAIGFGEALGLSAPGYDNEANGLWVHSLSTGVDAEHLAAVEGYGDLLPSAAFTAGLLHDIGKAVMNKILTPAARADIRTRITRESLSRLAAEKAVLGADHSEIGACLLQRWSLPEIIVEAAAKHHAPVTKPAPQLSALVYLADCAVHLAGAAPGWEARLAQANNMNAELLGMEAHVVARFVSGVQQATQTLPHFKAVA